MLKTKIWEVEEPQKRLETIQDIVNLLLEHRGIKTKEEKEHFLKPALASVTLKSVGISTSAIITTLKRLEVAHAGKEQVIIYGDYDVDGITGTAILWETLIELGFNVMPYIPHRVDEGYGLSEKGIDNLLVQYPATRLIITVDNGIVAGKATAAAKTKKIDVIITDHHLPDSDNDLPDALAIVHTTNLCGAGVAWLLSKEIQKKFGTVPQVDSDIHLELAALGTVADLVPLTGANRAIVYHGLEKLSKTKRLGLLALYEKAAIAATNLGVYEIGHVIGPRLNAAGRLESAMDSLRLLCTKDRKRAVLLADSLDTTNQERQRIMQESVQHASMVVRNRNDDHSIIVIADEIYEDGIIGLIAGRLVEAFYKPAIVIAKREGVSKGSVRSIKGFNIIEFLRSQADLFVNVGGHPMAAGFSIKTELLEKLQSTLETLAKEIITPDLLSRKIKIDLEIPLNDVSTELLQSINQLAPFGMGNPEPVFLSKHALVREKRMLGKEGKHMRLILQGGEMGNVMEAVAFGMGERSAEIKDEEYIDVVYTISENEWKGNTRLQIKIKDFKTP